MVCLLQNNPKSAKSYCLKNARRTYIYAWVTAGHGQRAGHMLSPYAMRSLFCIMRHYVATISILLLCIYLYNYALVDRRFIMRHCYACHRNINDLQQVNLAGITAQYSVGQKVGQMSSFPYLRSPRGESA